MHIHEIKSYQFTRNDIPLLLILGSEIDPITGEIITGDAGLRWSVRGCDIPFPVRSGSWFCGLSHRNMFDWLKHSGYELEIAAIRLHQEHYGTEIQEAHAIVQKIADSMQKDGEL